MRSIRKCGYSVFSICSLVAWLSSDNKRRERGPQIGFLNPCYCFAKEISIEVPCFFLKEEENIILMRPQKGKDERLCVRVNHSSPKNFDCFIAWWSQASFFGSVSQFPLWEDEDQNGYPDGISRWNSVSTGFGNSKEQCGFDTYWDTMLLSGK